MTVKELDVAHASSAAFPAQQRLQEHPLGDRLYERIDELSKITKSACGRGAISQTDALDLLIMLIRSAPYGSAGEQLGKIHLGSMMMLLATIKSLDIDKIVELALPEDIDILMIYLYKGLAEPEHYRTGVLLTWHEKCVDKFGPGCITRAMCQTKNY